MHYICNIAHDKAASGGIQTHGTLLASSATELLRQLSYNVAGWAKSLVKIKAIKAKYLSLTITSELKLVTHGVRGDLSSLRMAMLLVQRDSLVLLAPTMSEMNDVQLRGHSCFTICTHTDNRVHKVPESTQKAEEKEQNKERTYTTTKETLDLEK